MKCLRYILAFGCMTAWLWLALYGYADTEFGIYDDAFGHLLAFLPVAALALAGMARRGESVKAHKGLVSLWTPASLCMMLPVLLGCFTLPFIRDSLSQGITVNYLFAFLSVIACCVRWA